MKSKNSRTVAGKSNVASVDTLVRLIQVLNGGKHARVMIPGTGRNVHAHTGTDAFTTALTETASKGFQDRLLAEAALIDGNFPELAATIRAALTPELAAV
jgi:hypothetical protein